MNKSIQAFRLQYSANFDRDLIQTTYGPTDRSTQKHPKRMKRPRGFSIFFPTVVCPKVYFKNYAQLHLSYVTHYCHKQCHIGHTQRWNRIFTFTFPTRPTQTFHSITSSVQPAKEGVKEWRVTQLSGLRLSPCTCCSELVILPPTRSTPQHRWSWRPGTS